MDITNALRAELSSLAPSSVIELYKIETIDTLHGVNSAYLFSSTVNAAYNLSTVYWAGEEYWPFPIEAEGFTYNGKGTLPRPTMRVSNAEGVITSILAEVNIFNPGNDLIGAKVTRIRTLARFMDAENFDGGVNPYGTPDPESKMPDEVYYIDRKSMECREFVEFELVARYDLTGVRAPKRQCLKRCGWVYRGDGCGYVGGGFVEALGTPTNRVVFNRAIGGATYSGETIASFNAQDLATYSPGTYIDADGREVYLPQGQAFVPGKFFDENDNEVFTAAEDKCGHRLSSCKLRFGENAELPYGGFPGIGNYNF